MTEKKEIEENTRMKMKEKYSFKKKERKGKTEKKTKHSSKQKKQLEPQYYMSAVNIRTMSYRVYYMNAREKLCYFCLAFAIGAAVGYLFYGGIGTDEFGRATQITRVLNVLIPTVCGIIAGKLFLPVRNRQLLKKRQTELARQFRDMLEALTTSLGAGNNVADSFRSAYQDMQVQYAEGSYILNELQVILAGFNNNVQLEETLEDLGNRSGNDDIKSFAEVFKICYRKGGNMKEVIRNTHDILSDKMGISEEIITMISSNKSEQNIMMVMPVILIALIKSMSPEMAANFVTPMGILSTTVALGIFGVAYYLGNEILDIKV